MCFPAVSLSEPSLVDRDQFVQLGTGQLAVGWVNKDNSHDPAQTPEAMGGAGKIHFRFKFFG
jgi:hypothetical protein